MYQGNACCQSQKSIELTCITRLFEIKELQYEVNGKVMFQKAWGNANIIQDVSAKELKLWRNCDKEL